MTDYQVALRGMESMISDPSELIQSFKRGAYEGGFQKFYLKQVPVFDAIEHLYTTVVEKDTMLENMAEAFAKSADDFMQTVPKRDKSVMNVNLSLAVAGFVFPSILQYGGESSQPLIAMIQKRWKEHFPKSNISAASYEDIEKGFHRKWCYITTAACQYRGMEDDCEELNLLRAYRDTYMMSRPEGAQLIHDYYDIAPSIVKHINRRSDCGVIYDDLWDRYISPCIDDIRSGRMQECLDTYSDMVREMKDRYFHLYPYAESEQR